MMSIIRRFVRLPVAIVLLMIAVACSGCGTSAYEDQMEKANRSLRAEQQPAETDSPDSDETAQ